MRIDQNKLPEHWYLHVKHIESLGSPRLLEFGAGKHLGQNVLFSKWSTSQTVVDLVPLLDCDLANRVAQVVSRLADIEYHPITSARDLAYYGITYIAPLDIAASPFKCDSFDCCVSSYTLEHIPRDAIVRIFTELRRILRSRGLVSVVIDYSDHYSHSDRQIGALEFLRFSDAEYEHYNHRCHYVNRLRHHDYERMFLQLNYEVLASDAKDYATPPSYISAQFDSRLQTTLATKGVFLLQNIK
jgi:SAM-dependent methyltransferase